MYCANFLNPTYQALPELLASTNYRIPFDPKNTAVQKYVGYPDTDLMNILSKSFFERSTRGTTFLALYFWL
jgi:hypothetical protein